LRKTEERSAKHVSGVVSARLMLSFQIFDILPIYGTLNPREMMQTTFTFYGHANIISAARAICEVEGGPTYEITLKGEASLVDYKFDYVEIDYNKIVSQNDDPVLLTGFSLFV